MGQTRYVGPNITGGKEARKAERVAELGLAGEPLAASNTGPLSFGQLRLWFLDQLEPGTATYNMPMAMRLTGPVDKEALKSSLETLVARHDSLRTRFLSEGEDPKQVVQDRAELDFATFRIESNVDSGGTRSTDAILPQRERSLFPLAVQQAIQAEINRPFDLSNDHLLRVRLFEIGSEDHVLLVTMHHIISDEWSLKIFFNELGALYAGHVSTAPARLPEIPAKYLQYAIRQHAAFENGEWRSQFDYWREHLKGREGIFEISTDHPRKGGSPAKGGVARRELGTDLTERCRLIEKQQHVTSFMLHLAAFNALLARYTEQEDILVACPAGGRSEMEFEGAMGFFVNTLLLRANVDPEKTFSALLQQIRANTIDSYGNQEAPIEKVLEELQPERSSNHLSFTRLMFGTQNQRFERAKWGDLDVEFLEVTTDNAKFDLTFLIQGSSRGLIAHAEYDSGLFERQTIERMLEHYEILLRAAVQQPETKIRDLPLLSENERKLVLEDWNATATSYPGDRLIQEIFEKQVDASPGAVAVAYGENQLTYRELNTRANQLARYVRAAGIDRDMPVAVCVERSPDLVVAMLAVLKAGGAYVPVDPEYPAERLEYMLRDTRSPVLLTEQRLLARLPKVATPICLDGDWELISRESKENLNVSGSPEQLAYVMYTSGSTGKPKGAAVPHRAVNRLVLNSNYIHLGPADRIAQVSNISFDAATFEIWGSLLNGGTLVGIPSDVMLSPTDFGRALEEQKISAMFLTAALFNQIAAEAREAFQGLETLIVGGEALDAKWIRRVLRGKPPRRLVNGYGPTENTTFTCCHLITQAPEDRPNIPIGRPISNTRVYILDRFGNPSPIGVPGELYTGGDGLAQGYWRQPELTAEHFGAFLAGSDERLYKTGDIARYLPNGDVEFLGRTDDQVKVRGFRIELGEVEAALARFPGIKNCAAKVWGVGAEHKRLAVYYVLEEGANVADLRGFMRRALPAHMQPSAYVQLPCLPLTPNGKVNRNALPDPDQGRPAEGKIYRPPRDPVERKLAAVWQDVLGVNPVGIEDRFFDLGGHSLLAVRLVSRIEKEFGRKLRLSTIFQAPSIQDLSPILRDEVKESTVTGKSSVVEIQARGARKPLFLVHGAGGGMFWGYMNLSRRLGPDQPVYGFRSRGLDGRREFERVEEMAEDYVDDLRAVQPSGPYYLGGYCFGGNVAYEMARLLKAQGEEVALLALFNCSPPNSAYTQIKVTPRWLWRFAKNLLHWKDYFLQWTPAQRKAFFQWKWQQGKKRLRHLRRALTERNEADIGDLIDLSSFTTEERKVWEAHIRALLRYRPKSYDGKVHLFRSPSHPLWCSLDEDYGWGGLAKGGVEVNVVPAAHEKILEEPCVQELARELNGLLAAEAPTNVEVTAGSAREFWKTELRGIPALLELPTDRPRPAVQSGKIQSETISVSAATRESLEKLSRELKAQLPDVLLAGLHSLLYRYTRQEDVVIARAESGDALPIRVSIADDTPFARVVGIVSERLNAGRQNRKPFAEILSDLGVQPEACYHPVTQVGFAYVADGLEGSTPIAKDRSSRRDEMKIPPEFDLSWKISAKCDRLEVELSYAEDLFDLATAKRMLRHWETLLAATTANPRQRVGELTILPADERRTVLETWNATHKEYPKDKTLAQLFQDQALRTPDAAAAVSGQTRLTYRELYDRASIVAAQLRARGVGREDLVGICAERSWEMLAGILGTLLAGAAYVPMDPNYPADRLSFMLQDARMKVLFTQGKVRDKLPESSTAVLLTDDIDWSNWKSDGETDDHSAAEPADIAYVIYTSGSTGKPKGVAIEHRNAVALVSWAKDVFTTEELAGVLASTSICFDLSIFEMFVPLCLGGKIILAENALALPSLPAANEVRLINTVPSAARELLRAKGIPASVQVINLAGEPLPTALVDALHGQTSIKKVYDLYGPTETTTYSTYSLRVPGARPSIGKPLANEQVYLLDSKQQPVPIGVPGELFIGGDGVARGYLNRPELTAERFLSNPFRSGERVYRTGDLARWRADGNLEFLGRLDNQVKVRGFRIELGEIESALRKFHGLKDVVVMAREDRPGQKRLVAYAAVDPAAGLTAESMRIELRKSLPEYMVPPVFMLLEALPMTPNGKVDRKALPVPQQAEPRNQSALAEAKTPTQALIASAWREVLQVADVDVTQNFFEAGGDSLQAAQVISRVQQRLAIKLPLSGMFEAPTIESLSEAIESGRWDKAAADDIPLAPIMRAEPLLASFVQELLWFFEQLLPGNPAYNVTGAWRIRGPLDCAALEKAFQSVAARHETLRTSFAYHDGLLRQIVAPSVAIPFHAHDLSGTAATERDERIYQLLSAECRRPFDIGRAPLMRAIALRISAVEHVLLVVAHHTIFDGWSFGVLLRELQAFYRAQVSGAQPLLPEMSAQYADFSAWQRECMKGSRLLGELEYWKRKLAGAPEYLELPADHPEADRANPCAARFTAHLDNATTSSLNNLAQKRSETTFHVLMSALAITLAKWTGREEMVIGTVVAGRNRSDIENVIGCFMNFLPIRLNLADAGTADTVLQRVKSTIVEGQAHQDCPFEKIVEAVNPERRLDRNPLYNVALLFQNYRMGQWQSAGLDVSPMTPPATGALLDLRFEIEPDENGLMVACDYKQELFEQSTIERLVTGLCQTLQQLAANPSANLSELGLDIPSASHGAAESARQARVAIASTFTAEPVAEPLKHWFRELELPIDLEFAPFNQVFQELLDAKSLLRSNKNGLNVLLIRLEDWDNPENEPEARRKKTSQESGIASGEEILQRNVREFVLALRNAASGGKIPWLVTICPNSPGCARIEAYGHVEKALLRDLDQIPGVHVLSAAQFQQWYPVKEYYDATAEELGKVPYTPLFFTALGTALARKYHALKRPPVKVIVLDCDHTLWCGVCGEDGAKGVGLTQAFQQLQEFMRIQHEAGKLLCLCSKNNERDVLEVFEQRDDMPLRREHFAAWRLNWQPKSENLKSLAAELGLGLESFVFIDDNPLECADVEANCPDVLTLQLPEDPDRIPEFLRHAWIFDHLKLTAEDRKRSEMYRQNRERERLREQSLSLSDFLASLELQIKIEALKPEHLARAAQLTQRTNQFNLTTIRRTEAELQALAQRSEVVTISVKDRFGDYGLTGLLIFKAEGSSLDVDTFLLSCRVLGRGVEHKMLSWLGGLAQERKLNWVDVHFHTSPRNRPGLDFLESVGAPFRQSSNGGYLFRVPSGFAAEVVFNSHNGESAADSEKAGQTEKPESKLTDSAQSARFPKFSRCREIALEFGDARKIHRAIEARAVIRTRGKIGYVPPRNDVETKLCGIWQELLRVEKVGVRDNFFELGGHSLLAVRLFAEIEKQFGRKLPLVTLFQNPTIRKLARMLGQAQSGNGKSLLVPLQPQGNKPPLFLVHGAGGDVLWGYANLAGHLPSDQPIYGIKSRGQDGNEEFHDIREMAAFYVREIRRHQSVGPYYLGGYCFGGNVAYEMARQLRTAGEQVALVLLLDAAPSNAGYEQVTWWRPSYPLRFGRNLAHWLQDFATLSRHDQKTFFKRKFGALYRKTVRRMFGGNGQPAVDLEDVIDPSHFPEHELKLWQVHLDAMSAHVDKPFDGEVVLIRTHGQPLFCSLEEDFCWNKLAKGGVRIRYAPGSHENVFMEPNVKELARAVEDSLQAAQAKLPQCLLSRIASTSAMASPTAGVNRGANQDSIYPPVSPPNVTM